MDGGVSWPLLDVVQALVIHSGSVASRLMALMGSLFCVEEPRHLIVRPPLLAKNATNVCWVEGSALRDQLYYLKLIKLNDER